MAAPHVLDIHAIGLLSARPAASSHNAGYLFFATDDNGGTWYESDGSAWVQTSQPLTLDAELAALAGLTSAADKVPYFTGLGTAALAAFTSVARTLLAATTAALQRTALGLGTVSTLDSDTDGTLAADSDTKIATQKAAKTYVDAQFSGGGGAPSSAHYVTTQAESGLSAETSLGALTTGLLKHTVSAGVSTPATAAEGTDYWKPGGTDVAVADGGTGASTAGGARTNLGLVIGTDVASQTDSRFTTISWRVVSGTTDTPVLADAGGGVSLESGSATTLTLPQNSDVAFPVGTVLSFRQLGAGLVTVAAGTGATVNARVGLKSAGQYARWTAEKTAASTWLLSGDLAA